MRLNSLWSEKNMSSQPPLQVPLSFGRLLAQRLALEKVAGLPKKSSINASEAPMVFSSVCMSSLRCQLWEKREFVLMRECSASCPDKWVCVC